MITSRDPAPHRSVSGINLILSLVKYTSDPCFVLCCGPSGTIWTVAMLISRSQIYWRFHWWIFHALLRHRPNSASYHLCFSWNNSLLWGRKENWEKKSGSAGRDAINITRVWPNIWVMAKYYDGECFNLTIWWFESILFSLYLCFCFSLSFSLHLSF